MPIAANHPPHPPHRQWLPHPFVAIVTWSNSPTAMQPAFALADGILSNATLATSVAIYSGRYNQHARTQRLVEHVLPRGDTLNLVPPLVTTAALQPADMVIVLFDRTHIDCTPSLPAHYISILQALSAPPKPLVVFDFVDANTAEQSLADQFQAAQLKVVPLPAIVRTALCMPKLRLASLFVLGTDLASLLRAPTKTRPAVHDRSSPPSTNPLNLNPWGLNPLGTACA